MANNNEAEGVDMDVDVAFAFPGIMTQQGHGTSADDEVDVVWAGDSPEVEKYCRRQDNKIAEQKKVSKGLFGSRVAKGR
jgi:hypothetical protein